ncbi:MAG: hypothetical protein HY351_04105, partial [Candidatus Omnitrophica bacterium]|nr:hypothetical protein [Candidatus Omnitrophota bacterium]
LEGVNVQHIFQENSSHPDDFFDRYLNDLLKAKQDPNLDLKTLLQEKEKEVLLKISECINDPREKVSAKRKGILVLTTLATQGAVDLLLNSLASLGNQPLRLELIRALNKIRAKGERREFSPWIIKKEVIGEVRIYKSILTALKEYKQRKLVSKPDEDYLLATLQAIQEESLERIFRLLGLLYDSDIVHIIYDRLAELDLNKHVKANALELLQNVLEPELCRALYPVLDDAQWVEMRKKSLEEVVREFFESQDQWLVICAIFMVVELRLDHFRSQLEGMGHSQIPVIREAAEIALLKTVLKK